jgi:hypothetical protein
MEIKPTVLCAACTNTFQADMLGLLNVVDAESVLRTQIQQMSHVCQQRPVLTPAEASLGWQQMLGFFRRFGQKIARGLRG